MVRFPPLLCVIGCLAALLLPACATMAQTGGPPPSPDLATMQHVTRVLASDAFEGREPGTPGEEKTLAFLVEQFREAGLAPGNAGSWFHDVPLVELTIEDASALRIGGPAAGLEFAYRSDWVGNTYRETPRVALEDSELVFVGYGIVAPERGWDDYAGVDMRGKTAVILVNDPDWRSEAEERPFGGRAMTYYGRWTYKFEEAARQGAAAALIVHEPAAASYGWNVVESSWTGPQSRARAADGGADQTLVNAWISQGAAQALAKAAGHDLTALVGEAERPGFRAVPLGVTASLSFDNQVRHYSSKNVVGVLPGRTRPGEVVLHTAHWDHLGRCTPDAAGDDICNGAIDNATSVGGLVALAWMHAAAGPATRSLVFLAVTAEEQGLLGSEHYALNPVHPLDQTVAGLNFEGLYPMGPSRDVTVYGLGKSELDAVLARHLPQTGLRAVPDPAPQAGLFYRSDHFSFAKRGVPTLNLRPGDDLVDGGRERGGAWLAEYRAVRYHAPGDGYDEGWDWRGIAPVMRLYYAIGRDLADSGEWPRWKPGDEFSLIREQACAAPQGC